MEVVKSDNSTKPEPMDQSANRPHSSSPATTSSTPDLVDTDGAPFDHYTYMMHEMHSASTDPDEQESWMLLASVQKPTAGVDRVDMHLAIYTMQIAKASTTEAVKSLTAIVDCLREGDTKETFWHEHVARLVDGAYDEDDVFVQILKNVSTDDSLFVLREYTKLPSIALASRLRGYALFSRRHVMDDEMLISCVQACSSAPSSTPTALHAFIVVELCPAVFKASAIKETCVEAGRLDALCKMCAELVITSLMVDDREKWIEGLTESTVLRTSLAAYLTPPAVFSNIHRAHQCLHKSRVWPISTLEFSSMSALCTYVNSLLAAVEKRPPVDSVMMTVCALAALLVHYRRLCGQKEKSCLVLLDDATGFGAPTSTASSTVPMKKRRYAETTKAAVYVRGEGCAALGDVLTCGQRLLDCLRRLQLAGKCESVYTVVSSSTALLVRQFAVDVYAYNGKHAELVDLVEETPPTERDSVDKLVLMHARLHTKPIVETVRAVVSCLRALDDEAIEAQELSYTTCSTSHYTLLTAKHTLFSCVRVLRTALRRSLLVKEKEDDGEDVDAQLVALIVLSIVEPAESMHAFDEAHLPIDKFSRAGLSAQVITKGGLSSLTLIPSLGADAFWLSTISYWNVRCKLALELVAVDDTAEKKMTKAAVTKEISKVLEAAIKDEGDRSPSAKVLVSRFIIEYGVELVE